MRLWMYAGAIIIVSFIELFTNSTKPVATNQAILVPQQAHIVVLGKLQHVDSFVLRSASGERLYKSERIEYINSSTAIFHIPNEVPRTNADSLHAYNIKGIPRDGLLRSGFFNTMFEYFSAYDAYFFLSALFIGGLAFLFAFSSIMAVIAKIDLLYLFSGFSGIALYTLSIKQYHLTLYSQLSSLDLAALVLHLNFGMLLVLLKYVHKLKPNQRLSFAAPMGPWTIGLLTLMVSLVITNADWVPLFQITLLLALVLYTFIEIYKFTSGFSYPFKYLIISGIPLTIIFWSSLVLDFSSKQSMVIDAAILIYFIVLASFIAEQILREFNNSIALNQENLQMEIELGARQILSVENERKRMVQDLHQDVIMRVIDLADQSNQDSSDYTRIEAESKATLKSLRDYSYSLYPPYLEQLSLKNILQRELDRFEHLDSVAVIEINEPEATIVEQVFKLWVYRVFKKYLLLFCTNTKPEKLHLCLDYKSNLHWELRILHQTQLPIFAEPSKSLDADIEIYTAFYGALFEEIDSPFQKEWRFLKDGTKAGEEAQ